jgi:hypothetical protein
MLTRNLSNISRHDKGVRYKTSGKRCKCLEDGSRRRRRVLPRLAYAHSEQDDPQGYQTDRRPHTNNGILKVTNFDKQMLQPQTR